MAQRLNAGDLVEIVGNSAGFNHYLPIGSEAIVRVTVLRAGENALVKGRNAQRRETNQIVSLKDLKSITMGQQNPIKVAACLKAADDLLQANNTVTTLEIKTKLMNDPLTDLYFWDQDMVHTIMADACLAGTYKVVQDNGTYRTYASAVLPSTLQKKGRGRPKKNTPSVTPSSVATAPKKGRGRPKKAVATVAPTPTPQPARAAKKTGYTYINRTKALALMQNNRGHFFTADFIDKDGKPRTMNCQYLKDQTTSPLGYVKVKEQTLVRAGQPAIRSVNLQTLKTLRIAKVNYKIR